MEIGYTLMCEQAGPKQLVRDAGGGDAQEPYFAWAEYELLPALRAARR